MPTTIVFTTKLITTHFSESYVFVCGLDCTLTLFECPRTDISLLMINVVSAPPNPDLLKLRLSPCSLYTRPKELNLSAWHGISNYPELLDFSFSLI